MNVLGCLMLSISLAMDAFAASLCLGLQGKGNPFRVAWVAGLLFGGFQGLMPTLGYFVGCYFSAWLLTVNRLFSALLLCFLGGRMIWQACKKQEASTEATEDLGWLSYFVLALATSIDAWVAGLPLALLQLPIFPVAVCITSVTFLLCFFGVLIGKKIGARWQKNTVVLGGSVLILLGIRVLFGTF